MHDELQRAVRGFADRHLPVSHLRHLRDTRDPLRLSRPLWRDMARLGWAGIAIDEAHGGAGLGVAELGVVAEELGRTLAPTPFLATAVIGATALAAAPDPLRDAHLPAIAAGDRLVALGFEEERRFAPHACRTRATRTADGWRLDGDKVFVLDGPAADLFLITAQTDDGLALFAADRAAVEVTPLSMVDSRGAANLRLAQVAAERVADGAVLDRVLARATAVLAAEMLGGALAVFETTIQYLKDRRQFGVAIGSFQALKHRAAAMFCELELTRSIVSAALAAPDTETLVSAAKARASDTFVLVSGEAVQMHGGIGVTDELDVGFYYKRARVADQTFGSSSYHRDRFARLQGY